MDAAAVVWLPLGLGLYELARLIGGKLHSR